MTSDLDFDPALFGLWPKAPVYDGWPRQAADARLEEIARRVILETKAVSPLDDLQDMLNGMTRELREQMEQFRRLRRIVDEKVEAAGEEIDRKAIQADAKASIDAMSVIVRTLEKIDSLQRTIAHDRQAAADTEFDAEKYRTFVDRIDTQIESRASVLADKRIADAIQRGDLMRVDCAGGGATDEPNAARGSPAD